MLAVLAICSGACVGALSRWGLSLWLNPHGPMPLGTLTANLVGGYLVGVCVAVFEAMPQLAPGQILEVVSDCPQSINNIPIDAKNHGYAVLEIQQDGPTIRYLIRR